MLFILCNVDCWGVNVSGSKYVFITIFYIFFSEKKNEAAFILVMFMGQRQHLLIFKRARVQLLQGDGEHLQMRRCLKTLNRIMCEGGQIQKLKVKRRMNVSTFNVHFSFILFCGTVWYTHSETMTLDLFLKACEKQ